MTTSKLLSVLFLLLLKAISVTCRSDSNGFTLGIRDSLMVAHSFHDHPSFGPAGGMHGATYTCDVDFSTNELHPELNWVIDIGQASTILAAVLSKYNLKNLDEVFPNGEMTTTEFMCHRIHQDICEQLKKEGIDFDGSICVKLWESHKAWASYRGLVATKEG
mmetsp:Transcript_29840/g.62368  ORF Transcript_29840/g.62368 Transcript_29840/m.62368 type:complete len:162 (+) Transcript_29840:40-525(+)